MTKRLPWLMLTLLLLMRVSASAQGNGYNAARQATFITTGSDITLQQNSLIAYHEIIWTPNASVVTCTASVDSSVDGVTWTTGGIITSKNCASPGNTGIPSAAVQANYIRLTILTLTGTNASVTIQYEGWAYAPAGSSSIPTGFSGPGGSCSAAILANGIACTGAAGSVLQVDDTLGVVGTGLQNIDGSAAEVGGGAELLGPSGGGGFVFNPGTHTAIMSDNTGDSCSLNSTSFSCTTPISGGSVASVFGRTGAVVAATNDYNFNQLAGTVATTQVPTGGSAAAFLNGAGTYTAPTGNSGIFESGWASSTPAGTQFFSAVGRQGVLTAGAAANFAVVPRAITITGISANVTAAEGAAATIAITLDTCTTSACTAVSTTLATCTIGNSASTCSATGLSVAITAGQLIVAQTVQTGTGTAQVGGVGFTYN